MSIRKTDIRNRIEKRIRKLNSINPNAAAPITVVHNPFRELDPCELPCIKIGFMQGTAEYFNNSPEYERLDELEIAYIAQANDTLNETLEKAEEVISDFMIRDHANNEDPESLYSMFDDLKYMGWSSQYEKGEVSVAAVKLRFKIKYYTKHDIDCEELGVFDTAYVEIKPHDSTDDTRIIAADTIDLSED